MAEDLNLYEVQPATGGSALVEAGSFDHAARIWKQHRRERGDEPEEPRQITLLNTEILR